MAGTLVIVVPIVGGMVIVIAVVIAYIAYILGSGRRECKTCCVMMKNKPSVADCISDAERVSDAIHVAVDTSISHSISESSNTNTNAITTSGTNHDNSSRDDGENVVRSEVHMIQTERQDHDYESIPSILNGKTDSATSAEPTEDSLGNHVESGIYDDTHIGDNVGGMQRRDTIDGGYLIPVSDQSEIQTQNIYINESPVYNNVSPDIGCGDYLQTMARTSALLDQDHLLYYNTWRNIRKKPGRMKVEASTFVKLEQSTLPRGKAIVSRIYENDIIPVDFDDTSYDEISTSSDGYERILMDDMDADDVTYTSDGEYEDIPDVWIDTRHDMFASDTPVVLSAAALLKEDCIHEGVIFDIKTAWDGIHTSYSYCVKILQETIDDTSVCRKYLQSVALSLRRLDNCENIIKCFGMSQDCRELVMECATNDNLRSYLQFESCNYDPDNTQMASPREKIPAFIRQICRGFEAVQSLEPVILFYYVSVGHVLLDTKLTCKLTGFAAASDVRAREEWETDNEVRSQNPVVGHSIYQPYNNTYVYCSEGSLYEAKFFVDSP